MTIIKNLELYGLDPQAVASTLQQKVQASATIVAIPGAKDRSQVQIQGNQINHLAKLLLGKCLWYAIIVFINHLLWTKVDS